METTTEKKPNLLERIFGTGKKKNETSKAQEKEAPELWDLYWDKLDIQQGLEELMTDYPSTDKDLVKKLEYHFTKLNDLRKDYKGQDLDMIDKTARRSFVYLGEDVISYAHHYTENKDFKKYLVGLMGSEPTEKDRAAVRAIDTRNFLDQVREQAKHLLSQPSEYDLAYNEKYLGYNHQKNYEQGWEKLKEYAKLDIDLNEVGTALKSIYSIGMGHTDSQLVKEGAMIRTSTGELETAVEVSRGESIAHLKSVFEKALEIRPDLISQYTKEENNFLHQVLGMSLVETTKQLFPGTMEALRQDFEGVTPQEVKKHSGKWNEPLNVTAPEKNDIIIINDHTADHKKPGLYVDINGERLELDYFKGNRVSFMDLHGVELDFFDQGKYKVTLNNVSEIIFSPQNDPFVTFISQNHSAFQEVEKRDLNYIHSKPSTRHMEAFESHKPELKELSFAYDQGKSKLTLGDKSLNSQESHYIILPWEGSLNIAIYSEGNKGQPVLKLNNITEIVWPSADDSKRGIGVLFQSSQLDQRIGVPLEAIGAIVTTEVTSKTAEAFSVDLRQQQNQKPEMNVSKQFSANKGNEPEVNIGL